MELNFVCALLAPQTLLTDGKIKRMASGKSVWVELVCAIYWTVFGAPTSQNGCHNPHPTARCSYVTCVATPSTRRRAGKSWTHDHLHGSWRWLVHYGPAGSVLRTVYRAKWIWMHNVPKFMSFETFTATECNEVLSGVQVWSCNLTFGGFPVWTPGH
jgi:hypothetical protein